MTIDDVRLSELIALGRARGASDLHVGAGDAPALRINGAMIAIDVPPLPANALIAFVTGIAAAEHAAAWTANGTADLAVRSGTGAPYRLHAYRTMRGPRLAFRFHRLHTPALDTLALPAIVATFAARSSGLILFTGPTGSGKTTALAALVDRINTTRERVIVTIEDPIEYVHTPQRSTIAHCEIGTDVGAYDSAVRSFMRADPDVILVGEMRDRATTEAVLTAAETGHLVLSTLHTADAAQTIDRIIDVFTSDAQAQVRTQLAAVLVAIVSLRLVPLRNGNGRIAAAEVLIGTDAVRALIRDGKTHQVRNAIATGRAAGMRTLEVSLSNLVVRGAIALDTARALANRPDDVRDVERVGGMTEYRYTARTAAGDRVRGLLAATDREGAIAGLRRRALFVTAVETRRPGRTLRLPAFGGSGRARVAFFRSFATLVRAGVPLRRGLAVAIERCEHPPLAAALRDVLADIERGDTLSDAFGRRPSTFGALIVAMVAAGESGGILDAVLERIAAFLERDAALRKTVVAALAYPATVLTAALSLVAFLIVRVVPMFSSMFAAFRVPLPLSTRVLIAIGDAAAQPALWSLALVGIALAIAGLVVGARTRAGRLAFDRFRLGIPFVGTLLRKTIVARFARMTGTLVHSGIELSAALDVAVPVTGSPLYAAALTRVARALREGEALTPPLAACGLFDPMLIALVGVGEETGMLDELLPRAADYFEDDVAAAVATLGAVIEPALILFLGVIVGAIVYAVFIPLYSLIGSVGQ